MMLLGTAVAALPLRPGALETELRTASVSGLPLGVDPAPPLVLGWIEWMETLDGSPVALTLSDGGRWRASPLRPRGELTLGTQIWRLAWAFSFGEGVLGLSVQADLLRGSGWKLGTTVAGRATFGGGRDLAFIPTYSMLAPRWEAAPWLRVVPFGAARLRWGQTLYEVQGWSADRSSPYASVLTRDLALAPMLGAAAVTRHVELRVTAGWEILLVDRVEEDARQAGLHRGGGPFVAAALRLWGKTF